MVTIRIGDAEEDLTWEQWEDRVAAGRIPPDALVRFEPVTGAEFVRAEELDVYDSLNDDSRRSWGDRYRSGSPPWMTALVAGVQIRLWWLVFTASAMWAIDGLQLFQPLVYEDGQVWRLFTAGLTHADLGHIASNLVMFVYVGWFLERALGRINLLTIFLAAVLGGSVLSISMTPATGSIGSSGGVLGVVAAATVFGFVRYGLLPDRARVIFGVALLPYLILIYAIGWSNASTDNWAHTGGLVTGAALALVLDPPGLERRRRWNALIWTSTGVVSAAVLLSMWIFGPHLIQTEDTDLRARIKPDPRVYDDLEWTTPTTWRPASVTGGMGYASQADPRRFWVVRTTTRTRPTTVESELAGWRDDIRSDWAETAAFSDARSASIGGHPGLHQTVTLGDPADQIQERWVAVRGSYVLGVTWSADLALAARLAPLRDRLVNEVAWDEPANLVEARGQVERRPKSRPLRRKLASELLLAGEGAESLALWQALIAERSDTPDGWVGLLDLIRVQPELVPDRDAVFARALATVDDPEVHAAVATAMYEDQPDRARGLLEEAWLRRPGDRHLRRIRKSLGQPTALRDVTPAHLWFDPLTAAPLEAPRTTPVDGPLTLDAAAARGRTLRQERDALIDLAVAQRGPRAIATLVLLRRRQLPALEDLPFALKDTARDLSGMAAGREVTWLDPIEEERLLDLVPFSEADGLALTPPEADQPQAFAPYLERLGLGAVDGPEGPLLRRY